MSHWRAKGGQTCRGSEPIRPSFEPDAQRGPNVIQFPSADHHHRFLPDDRSNSRRLEAAEFFIPPFEFGSWALTVAFFTAPSVFVGAAIVFYALLIA